MSLNELLGVQSFSAPVPSKLMRTLLRYISK